VTCRSRKQLVLDLELAGKAPPAQSAPEGLVQALADLLLEALGERPSDSTKMDGGRDEFEDNV
jgi:hypothetical protein